MTSVKDEFLERKAEGKIRNLEGLPSLRIRKGVGGGGGGKKAKTMRENKAQKKSNKRNKSPESITS